MRLLESASLWTVFLAGALCSCKDAAPLKWVDLRYIAEDSYLLTAASPEPVRLQVKSTDPWKVYGTNPAWCSISPSEGSASELFDVTVQYTENTELDDRLDTLVIQSDYWIGKWIPVRQKGTAYLEAEGAEDLDIGQFGGEATFRILANQKWSLKTDAGDGWIRLSENCGEGDREITVSVSSENKGERRSAEILVLNRHGEEEFTVTVNQDGVVLAPSLTRVKTDHLAKDIAFSVSSNTEWRVEKEDAGTGWIDFPQTAFNGDGDLVIRLAENTGTAIRTGVVLLKTMGADGFTQIVKSITVRQAYDPAPDYLDFDGSGLENWIINGPDNDKSGCKVVGDCLEIYGAQKIHRYNCPAGRWEFFMKRATAAASPVIYFQCGDFDMRWFVDAKAGKTDCTVVDKGNTKVFPEFNVPYSNVGEHVFGIGVTPGKNGEAVFSWMLDGTSLGTYAADGADVTKSSLTFSSSLMFHIFVGAYEGGGTADQTVVWSGWQYTLPYEFIDWGE